MDNLEIKNIIDCLVAIDNTEVNYQHDDLSRAVYNVISNKYNNDYNKLLSLYNHHNFKKYTFQLIRLANDVRLAISNMII